MSAFRIEDKISGAGEDLPANSTFNDACRAAQAKCTTDCAVWCVWELTDNWNKVAEATLRGVRWRANKYRNLTGVL